MQHNSLANLVFVKNLEVACPVMSRQDINLLVEEAYNCPIFYGFLNTYFITLEGFPRNSL